MAAPKNKKPTTPKKKAVKASSKNIKKISPKKVVKKPSKKSLKKVAPKKAVKKVVKKPAKKISKSSVKKTSKKTLVPKKKLPLKKVNKMGIERSPKNPVMGPAHGSHWESEGVFNPGAVIHGDRVHLFYRALGPDGISRVGYASSKDGIHFDKRFPYPVYMPESFEQAAKHHPFTSPARLHYDKAIYASGGGWGGCEDPRAVKIDERIYITFNMFNGWNSIRVGLTSISEKDLEEGRWRWSRLVYLSPSNQRHKNWTLFPEKINGKYAIFHNLYHPDTSRVQIEYLDGLDKPPAPFESADPQMLPDRIMAWHNRTRSIGPPPIKTEYGWLVLYHAMDKDDPGRYKLGALMLDINDPSKVLYRARYPLLEPDEWYENDWKPGIIYASGAVVKDDKLYIYYGGGDKYIAVAHTNLKDFVKKLMNSESASFSKKTIRVS